MAPFLHGQESGSGTQDPTKLEEIPSRLFQVQDQDGFFWQAAGTGAITSGETQYLQSGLNLIAAGEQFSPGVAFVREPGEEGEPIEVEFEEQRENYQINRSIWFDIERSAVRVFDTFQNTGTVTQTISLQWRSTFPFPWQSLHGSGGELLNTQPALELSKDDYGMVVHFSQSEGRHDTLFILGGERSNRPDLSASSNSRELSFSQDLILKPGESRSVLYWILQRNLTDLEEAGNSFTPFYQRSKLVVPRVSTEVFDKIVNFPADSFPTSGVSPNLRNLFSLNSIVNSVGLHRRGEDILWISNANQLACEVDRSVNIDLTSPTVGDVSIPVSSVAAIQGSAGSGRKPLLFLRDGQVLTGEFAEKGITAKTGGSDTADLLEFSEINLLLLSASPQDGDPPGDATHFVETLNEEVIAVSAPAETVWTVTSPWGDQAIPFSEIEEVHYSSTPFPAHRVLTKDGSLLDVFSSTGPIRLVSALGENMDLNMSAVIRIRRAGALKRKLSEFGGAWIDFAEIPEDVDSGASVLLSGNNLLSGKLEEKSLSLSVDGTEIALDTNQIASLTRVHSLPENTEPDFEVELVNKDRLRGTITSPFVSLDHSYGALKIPIATLQSYRIPNSSP